MDERQGPTRPILLSLILHQDRLLIVLSVSWNRSRIADSSPKENAATNPKPTNATAERRIGLDWIVIGCDGIDRSAGESK
jgi:hypothetical protein